MTQRISAAWEDYRRRAFAAVLVPAIGLAASGALGIAIDRLHGPELVFYVAAALAAVGSLAAWVRLATFPCPKCGRWFAMTTVFSNPLTDRCLHCGHGKWQFVHHGRAPVDRNRPRR